MATLYIHCQLGKNLKKSKKNLFIKSTFHSFDNLGDETTENCLTLSGIMYEAEWYNHPSALHRYYILMIANMQRPLAFDGFYVVLLNLETYKQVCLFLNKQNKYRYILLMFALSFLFFFS